MSDILNARHPVAAPVRNEAPLAAALGILADLTEAKAALRDLLREADCVALCRKGVEWPAATRARALLRRLDGLA